MALLQGLLKSLIKYLFPVEQKRVILKQNIFAYLNPEGKGVFRILSECEVKYASRFLNTADSIFTYNLLYSKRTNPFQSLFGSFAYHSLALERHFFSSCSWLSSNNLQFYWLLWRKPIQNNSGSGKAVSENQGLIRVVLFVVDFTFTSWIPYHSVYPKIARKKLQTLISKAESSLKLEA